MRGLVRGCIYQIKNTFRDKSYLFWNLLYPIILVLLFYTAFSGVMEFELEKVSVGIESDSPLAVPFSTIDIIEAEVVDKQDVESYLLEEKIVAFVDNDLSIEVARSGINQTVVKEIVDQIKQMETLGVPFESYDMGVNYIDSRDQDERSFIIMFYALIAMVSTYSIYAGIESIHLIQANLSNIGARINVSPLRKESFILSSTLVAMGLNVVANGILLLFIEYILKIELINQLSYSLIFILLGNLFGVSLGIFIGASSRKGINFKTNIGIGMTLFLAAISGMMGPWIKIVLSERVPFLAKYNPISIVSDNLYRVNILDNTSTVYGGVILLLAYAGLFILLSFLLLRRRTYDSI